ACVCLCVCVCVCVWVCVCVCACVFLWVLMCEGRREGGKQRRREGGKEGRREGDSVTATRNGKELDCPSCSLCEGFLCCVCAAGREESGSADINGNRHRT